MKPLVPHTTRYDKAGMEGYPKLPTNETPKLDKKYSIGDIDHGLLHLRNQVVEIVVEAISRYQNKYFAKLTCERRYEGLETWNEEVLYIHGGELLNVRLNGNIKFGNVVRDIQAHSRLALYKGEAAATPTEGHTLVGRDAELRSVIKDSNKYVKDAVIDHGVSILSPLLPRYSRILKWGTLNPGDAVAFLKPEKDDRMEFTTIEGYNLIEGIIGKPARVGRWGGHQILNRDGQLIMEVSLVSIFSAACLVTKAERK